MARGYLVNTFGPNDRSVSQAARSHNGVRDAFRGTGVYLLQTQLALPLERHDVLNVTAEDKGKTNDTILEAQIGLCLGIACGEQGSS